MRVLHLMTTCSESSASYRLHKSLEKIGIDSYALVLNKSVLDEKIIEINNNLKHKLFVKIGNKIDNFFVSIYKNRNLPFSASCITISPVINKINQIKPDIVVLHWINAGFLSIKDINRVRFPMVWCMHDMWAFTGGCHYDSYCDLYKESCGNCKVLCSNKKNDLSYHIWKQKKKYISKKNNLTLIGLSKWLQESASNSSLFKSKEILNLPNPIDVEIFKSKNKEIIKNNLKLNKGKKYILFGAVGALTDLRKGFKQLYEALKLLDMDNIELIIFGNKETDKFDITEFKVNYFGYVNDIDTMVSLYSAVDVMIVPSLQENLSNAIMESLSCSTPVVAFDIGGNSDMIEHKKNGYLAKQLDIKDLANGIKWVLENENYEELCQNAREKVVNNFESTLVANRYKELYEKILKESNG